MKARRRRARRSARSGNPFSAYLTLFSAGMEMAELLSSSTQVIAYRSDLISQALNGQLPLYHKEFTDMWQEKMQAGGESWLAAMRHLQSSGNGAWYLSKIMAPYRKKATSNARRLRRKK